MIVKYVTTTSKQRLQWPDQLKSSKTNFAGINHGPDILRDLANFLTLA